MYHIKNNNSKIVKILFKKKKMVVLHLTEGISKKQVHQLVQNGHYHSGKKRDDSTQNLPEIINI